MRTDHIRWVVDKWEDNKPVTKPGSARLQLQPAPEVLRDPDGLPAGDLALAPPSQWEVDSSWLDDPTSQDATNLRKKREAWLPPKPPVPVIDLPLEVPERVIFFLSVAAEIEHALMVQYLYAAYSLRIPSAGEIPEGVTISVPDGDGVRQTRALAPEDVQRWQDELLQIAREEMSHLATVENLLRSLGGALAFSRGDGPFQSLVLPFRYKLERVSLASLAKYVTAERPIDFSFLGPEEYRLVKQIHWQAARANDNIPVKQVGGVFQDLRTIIDMQLSSDDFHSDTQAYQASFDDWGFDPTAWYNRERGTHGEKLIVETIAGSEVQGAAIAAIEAIAEQGEGWDQTSGDEESHFERFFELYRQFASVALSSDGWLPTWPVATNPNTTGHREKPLKTACAVSWTVEEVKAASRIEHPRSLAWAKLLNQRYRMLLDYLQHFMLLDDPKYESDGDRTSRGLLLMWTFDEMRRIKHVSETLVRLPLAEDDTTTNAGPPFELPYMLCLPDRDIDRWRLHFRVSLATSRHTQETLLADGSPDADDPFLRDVLRADRRNQQAALALAKGQPLPDQPEHFQKVVQILEESVRGFDVLAFHRNFWACKTRDEFIRFKLGSGPIVDPGFDPAKSPLVNLITSTGFRMPLGRPPIPGGRLAFIQQWIQARCPDNFPAGQIGLVREGELCESPGSGGAGTPREQMLALIAKKRDQGAVNPFHAGIPVGNSDLNSLFSANKFEAILEFLLAGESPGGGRLVLPGRPDDSVFFQKITIGGMQSFFDDVEVSIVRDWINSLPAGTDSGSDSGGDAQAGSMLSFAADIRPLFRDFDVTTMKTFGLDLSDFADVSDNAEAIYSRLEDKSMPCDGPWPDDQIQSFRDWIDQGKNP